MIASLLSLAAFTHLGANSFDGVLREHRESERYRESSSFLLCFVDLDTTSSSNLYFDIAWVY